MNMIGNLGKEKKDIGNLGRTVRWPNCSLVELFPGRTVSWSNCFLAELFLAEKSSLAEKFLAELT